MTTLCIIRHGETAWNLEGKFQGREDISLNETGRKQAKNCIDYLSQYKWNRIISSPLKRAKETAEIFNEALECNEIEIFHNLIEMDFGSASGLLPAERTKKFPEGVIPDQEMIEEVTHRVLDEINRIHLLYPSENIIVVTHGMVISCLMSYLSNGELGSDYRELKNTCINHLVKQNEGWKIEKYNLSVQLN